MIVPKYWAEARVQQRQGKRQTTVRRFGWSNESPEHAQKVAEDRVQEALASIISGAKLPRREPKVAYNGAEGVPIREEIISVHGETVITRNIYGARCLNTPNVLFADIDFKVGPGVLKTCLIFLLIPALGLTIGLKATSIWLAIGVPIASLVVLVKIAGILDSQRDRVEKRGEERARARIVAFLGGHHGWHLRLYRSPAGMRVLVLHRTFEPDEPEALEFFKAVKADPNYVRLCNQQRCFRARVSPKPWRMGIEKNISPRPGVWPVQPERLPERTGWIEEYEKLSKGYAACRFVEAMGDGGTNPVAEQVRLLHDELCQAESSDLPVA